MVTRKFVAGVIGALLAFPSAALAQDWAPGSEIEGQSVQVVTNGVSNTVHFDRGGYARIVSPQGRVVNASWSAAEGKICLNSGGAAECWPYLKPFEAGQQITLTSDCAATSTWMANAVNPQTPPRSENMGERG